MREQKHAVMVESAEREGIKKRVAEMQQFLAEQQTEITDSRGDKKNILTDTLWQTLWGIFYDLTLLFGRVIYIDAKKSVLAFPERMKMQSVNYSQSVLLCERFK